MTPNKANIRLWVDALRSGDYAQCHNALNDGKGFCCLGVACEVAIRSGVDVLRGTEEIGHSDDGTPKTRATYDNNGGYPPSAVREWLGLPEANPRLSPPDGGVTSAVFANDSAAWTFARIADAIEHTYLGEE